MKNKKLIIGCLVGVGVIGIAIAFWGQKKSIDIPPYILQIFPTSTIRTQVEGTQYLIDSTEYHTKDIQIAGTAIHLVVENQDRGNIYRFYSSDQPPKLIKEVTSFIPSEDVNQILNENIFERDITGDGISEILIEVEQNASNSHWYQILQWQNDSLVNLSIKNQKDSPNWIGFDEINYKNGYTYITNHDIPTGGYSVWSVRYKLMNGILNPDEAVEFSLVKDSVDNCEIARSRDMSHFTVIGSGKCGTLGTDFDPYFQTP